MKTVYTMIIALLTFSILLSACNIQGNATITSTQAATETTETEQPDVNVTETATATAAGTAVMTPDPTPVPLISLTVNVGQDANLGSFLIDDQGRTLYLYSKDSINLSTCMDACATDWPPVLITETLTVLAGPGVDATKLGKMVRTGGGIQVTYNGWPLYYYSQDAHPGDVTGHAQHDFYAISPAGDKIEK